VKRTAAPFPICICSLFVMLALSLSPAPAAGQNYAEPFEPYRTDTPPVIDGILDDEVWQRAPSETGFQTYNPDYGQDMAFDTIVWYAYDWENLYFAYRCYDGEPDQIKSSISARDQIRPDDWICLNLDTFNDHQSLYAFYVNPRGIQMDSRFTTAEDFSVDVVWYSKGVIDDEGFTVEIRIPFKSIRYSHREPVEMGIIFERHISRLTEAGTYPPLDPRHGPNFLTQTRTLLYNDIRHYTLVEILPAVTWGGSQVRNVTTGPELGSLDDDADVSLTLKYGLTSRLIVDATVNPDFSQVEADAGQVDFNQRFTLYYPEKRPFFLEGRENFNHAGAHTGDPLGSVVYTRSIANPDYGVKLTGKVSDRNTIAAIVARDELFPIYGGSAPYPYGETADFAIFRSKQALGGDSFIGGFATVRDTDGSFNGVAGPDAFIRLDPSSTVGLYGFYSRTEDAVVDTTREGHALGFDYTYSTRDWLVNAIAQDLSKHFESEAGFVTRTGITRLQLGVLRMLRPAPEAIQRIDGLVHLFGTHDKYDDMWERGGALDLRLMMPRTTYLQVGYVLSNEIFAGQDFDTSNLRLHANRQFTRGFYGSVYYRYGGKIRYSQIDPWQGRGTTASVAFIYQPSEHLNSTNSWIYEDLYRESDGAKEYDYSILRTLNTYQINRYLFLRAIVEYNSFYDSLTTDFLISFTWIPGTVIHLGYGSLYEKTKWDALAGNYIAADRFLEMSRGIFFKASYLWRL